MSALTYTSSYRRNGVIMLGESRRIQEVVAANKGKKTPKKKKPKRSTAP